MLVRGMKGVEKKKDFPNAEDNKKDTKIEQLLQNCGKKD